MYGFCTRKVKYDEWYVGRKLEIHPTKAMRYGFNSDLVGVCLVTIKIGPMRAYVK
jgi:hypothetical protein